MYSKSSGRALLKNTRPTVVVAYSAAAPLAGVVMRSGRTEHDLGVQVDDPGLVGTLDLVELVEVLPSPLRPSTSSVR